MKGKDLISSLIRSLLAVTVLGAVTAYGQWSVKLATTGLSFAEFEFGTADGATAGWDQALEDPLPPALPNGAISGFGVNGAPFPFITLQDFRATGTAAAVYVFSYNLVEGATAQLDWSDAANAAAPLADLRFVDGNGTELLGAGESMATVSTLELPATRDGLTNIFIVLGSPQPVARDDVAYMLNQGAGSTLDIDVLANDYSPAMATLEVVDPVTAPPANGDADVTALKDLIVYDPDDAFFGVDTFKYKASDTTTESEEANVTVYVNENLIITPQPGQEPGEAGENVAAAFDIETKAGLAGVALEIILPRTQQDPPQIWTFVSAEYSDAARTEGLVPTVQDDGLGTLKIEFATLPTSLTLTLGAPDARVASSALVFDVAADSIANLETTPFPDVLPDYQIPMQFGSLDVDGDGFIFDTNTFSYDFDDIQILFNYISNRASGFSDQDILDFDLLTANTVSLGVSEDEIMSNVLSMAAGPMDVDGDGFIFDANTFSYDFDDIQILFNYISNRASGFSDQDILDFGLLTANTQSLGPGMTDEAVLANVLPLIN